MPELGEVVAYYTDEEHAIGAVVIGVAFWDVVDLRLSSGVTISGVRRVLAGHLAGLELRAGRFDRMR